MKKAVAKILLLGFVSLASLNVNSKYVIVKPELTYEEQAEENNDTQKKLPIATIKKIIDAGKDFD